MFCDAYSYEAILIVVKSVFVSVWTIPKPPCPLASQGFLFCDLVLFVGFFLCMCECMGLGLVFLSPVAAGFFILRRQQTRKLKKLFAIFKENLECLLKWCRSRKCLECSYIYWYIACILETRLLHLKESVGIILRPVGAYSAVQCPVSFSYYRSLSVIHWLSKASWFPCQQRSGSIKLFSNNLLILMSLLEDNPVSILSCDELIMLERTWNWTSAVAVQLISLIVKAAHRCILSCRTFC